MMRKAEWIRHSILTDILQSKESLYSKREHCGHKDELTKHVNTAVNSYAPVRYLRMGAFYITFRENFAPITVADLAFSAFLMRKGENTTLRLCGTKGGE